MTTRERVHRAFQSALKGAPSCAGVVGDVNHPSVSHSWLCDAVVEEFKEKNPGEGCTTSNLCTACPTFVCAKCQQLRPWCVGANDDKPDECDDCATADPAMPPPDVIEAMAKGCNGCAQCGEAPPCATCMAGGVCIEECRCGEIEDGSAEADELDYQEDDAR